MNVARTLDQLISDPVLLERTRLLHNRPVRNGPVLYWMSRDQRAVDNWALTLAVQTAASLRQPVAVVFFLQHSFLQASMGDRHYTMMLTGLAETRDRLAELNIGFYLLPAPARQILPNLAESLNAGLIVTDFNPIRDVRTERTAVCEHLMRADSSIPVVEVDAHNIVPWHRASAGRELAARTIRPKINRQLFRYLVPYPDLMPCPDRLSEADHDLLRALALKHWPTIGPVDPLLPAPGTRAGQAQLDRFIRERLTHYAMRNDPNAEVTAQLSPYFHFGQISPATAALAVLSTGLPDNGFLEEAIVRRELSDNYCAYEPDYDRFESLPAWGRRTLAAHRLDPRPRVYARSQLEEAASGDPLWNAAQTELLRCGRIAGYLRMYWAKKILEWRPDPEDAFALAIEFNDRYALDGRDPNGYVGVAWSIGGLHDRPFGERPVMGQIRPMTFEGCRRKFDVSAYISRMNRLGES
jgi:deoxyribodipyrimidine photo-lyase